MDRSGDFSCPPSGPGGEESVGSFIGPKGEMSCVLSHEPRVGGLGGLAGFQETDVVLTVDVLFELGVEFEGGVVLGNREKDVVEYDRPGSSVRVVVYGS